MAAADIGANFSSYSGNQNIGGYYGNALNIDTKPLEDLGRYSMFAFRNKQEQAEKDAQDKIRQLSQITTIDWQSAIEKERPDAIKAVEDLKGFAQSYALKKGANPSDYLDWQNHLNDAKRKVASINARFTAYGLRKNEIAAQTNEAEKARLQKILDEDVATTTVDDPLPVVQRYDVKHLDIPIPPVKSIKIARIGANDNQEIENKNIIDFKSASSLSFALVNGLMERQKSATSEGNEAMAANQVFEPILSAEVYTKAINQYKDAEGNLDINALFSSGSPVAGVAQQAEVINRHNAEMRARIKAGEFGTQLTASDYPDINWKDGITPQENVLIRMLAKAPAETHNEDITHTGAGDQAANRANALKIAQLKEAGDNYRAGLDLLGKGWTRNASGKLQPPSKASTTTETNGGIVPYWQNYIVPQIKNSSDLTIKGKEGGILGLFQSDTSTPIPNDYTGDVDIPADKISGLGVALHDVRDAEGKSVGYNEKTATKIRYINGQPVGAVIDGVFYDQNDINSKATRLQDKSIATKADAPIFDATPTEAPKPKNPSPIALAGKIDPSSLKEGQVYSVKGKAYVWDGKKLKVQ
jgi:hypothetical protein